MTDFYGELIQPIKMHSILEMLSLKFVDNNKIFENKLMWNCFKSKPMLLPFDKAKNLNLPVNVMFYLERQKVLYRTDYKHICDFIEQLEPWEDLDSYVFDESMDWIVAITHEENKVLTLGL